jgi:transcriptional regulator with XRE-family HTH domain
MRLNGDRLRTARQKKLLTLRELGAITGVGVDTINRLENGLQQPRISTIRKLAAALDVDAEYLIDWGDEGDEGKAVPLAA